MISELKRLDYAVATRIWTLAQAAYSVEARQIGAKDFPPLKESVANIQPDSFLVFRKFEKIIGALSFEQTLAAILITRLVVDPEHFRQGIATALVMDLERRNPEASLWKVTTAQANTPAIALYQKLCYRQSGLSNSPEGINLIHLAKSKR